jgi:hypothetical protein
MTTVINFTPTATANFQFQATLDGQVYQVTITWNIFGCRYYVNIYTLSGVLVASVPLIGTPLGYDLSSITSANNIAVATTSTPHTYTVGSVVPLVISGVTPANYNGSFLCNVLSNTQFSYSLPTELPQATQLGQVIYNLSLTAGYFSSTMVYSPDEQTITINP